MKYLLSCLLILLWGVGFGQIDSLRLMTNLEELAHDKYEGRATETAGNEMARAYIINQLDSIGLPYFDSTYVQPFSFWSRWKQKKYDGKNIIGFIEGSEFPNQYIVISAHYDHVGIKKEVIYNGADDNASGTCGLIELADFFVKNQPRYSIIFAFFDAEEIGLQGAKCFVDEPPVTRDSIILNLNMDMISRNAQNELYVCGTYHYPFLKKPILSTLKNRKIKVTLGHDEPNSGSQDWTQSSDHGAFHKEKIPFLYFGVEDHEDYHRPGDDFENIQPRFYKEAVLVVLEVIKVLDKQWEDLK